MPRPSDHRHRWRAVAWIVAAGLAVTSGLVAPVPQAAAGRTAATLQAATERTAPGAAATDPAAAEAELEDFLYVTNPASHALSIIDRGNGSISNVGIGGFSTRVAIAPNGAWAYVVNQSGNAIAVVDTTTEEVVASVPVGSRPWDVAVTPDSAHAYVTNNGANNVSVIDTSDNSVATTITVGDHPEGVVLSPDGGRAFVSNRSGHSISVINTNTNSVVATISLGSGAPGTGMAVTPDGHRLYVTGFVASLSGLTYKAWVIDTDRNKVLTNLGVGHNPESVAITADGASVYVANNTSKNVSVIATATNRVTTTIPIDGQLGDIALSPMRNRAYVVNFLLDSVTVIDTTTNTVITDLPAGNKPVGLAVLHIPRDQTAIVSLGDSYISGEAGRWRGNAAVTGPIDLGGDRWGTDRAAINCNNAGTVCKFDGTHVYGESFDNGCNRSDSAEIRSADIRVRLRVNLACSGARTINLLPQEAGGQGYLGEPPQIEQLRRVARHNQIKMVVLSIGGNDLGFASVLGDCVRKFTTHRAANERCRDTQQPAITQGLIDTRPKIENVVTQIKQMLAKNGYPEGSYRFVLQSYPTPIPTGAENRYSELDGLKRWTKGGCPMWNEDSDWAVNTVVPAIADMIKDVARTSNIDFLDVRNLLKGHEVCAKSARQATSANSYRNPQTGPSAEWVRFLTSLQNQGQFQESIHPNYFGQLALGACVTQVYTSPADQKNHACTNTAGKGPAHVNLTNASW